ncbi:MAG: bifunctional adenosylcobinamide kinase/adenosylcobinamide-phosphate guanylyltransferase [Ruminococcus sp.]|nr:bifunctional adenosylcobinamide kinase/adenosylcobinamide-phosphate guanylyltransferase [Ruminococcus sp.]
MIFVTGGAYQGKKDFVLKHFSNHDIINNYHIIIKNLISENADPIKYTENIIYENKDIVIIMNEIGCGIVPVDREERFWREICGKCGCIIAENADIVVRVTCGIGTAIKGDL